MKKQKNLSSANEVFYMEILRNALKDPELNGVDLIIPDTAAKVSQMLGKGAYVSEWLYEGAGPLRYKYHCHVARMGKELKALLSQGKCSSRPKLTNVYTAKELIAMAQ